jgi:UDP-glucose:(heptosyl)LPS alpha-1,3-glucosyltransferase
MKTGVGVEGGNSGPARRLRVAVLNRRFALSAGGAESYSVRLVEALAARHDMHVFAQHIDHAWPGVAYHRVPLWRERPRWLNQLWYALATAWLTRQGFDVVHSHEATGVGQVQSFHVKSVKGSVLGARRGLARVWRWATAVLGLRLGVYLALEHAKLRPGQPRKRVAVAPPLVADFVANYAQTTRAWSVISPGFDAPAQIPSRAQARQTLGLPESAWLLLLVANDFERKGLPALLRALQSLPPEVGLVVVGDDGRGQQQPRFAAQVASLGLGRRVWWLGRLSDMTPAYAGTNVLVHPTLEDTFGMAVLEAMGHGLPVVVSSARHCGVAAQLQDQVQAIVLTDPTDAPAIARAVHHLLVDPDAAQALAQRGQAWARQHTWQRVALAYEALYLQVAQEGISP